MSAGQQRLGAANEIDRDQRRLGRRLTGGVSQPRDRLLVAPLRAEHQVIRHVQGIRTCGHQRERRLAVQEAAGRRRDVLIDRVVHELVPEHDPVVGLVEQLRVERLAELPDYLGRRPAGDGGDIAERHGIAEHRGDLQQLERCAAGAAGGEPPSHSARGAAPTSSPRCCPRRGAAVLRRPASAAWPRPTTGSRRPWPAGRSGRGRAAPRARDRRERPGRLPSAAGAARCARPRPRDRRAAGPASADRGDGRAVTTMSSGESGNCRATDEIATRLALSAQWTSSVTSSTARSTHDLSTRSTISSTTWYWRSPPAGGGPPRPDRPAARRSPPCAGPVIAGSSPGRRRPHRTAACARTDELRRRTPPHHETRASSTRLCTKRVLPMPASPSITSADARPSLSWRTCSRSQRELGLPPREPFPRRHPR